MRVHELIRRLQSLPKKMQQLPVVTYEGSLLLPVPRTLASLIATGAVRKPELDEAGESSSSAVTEARSFGVAHQSARLVKTETRPPLS